MNLARMHIPTPSDGAAECVSPRQPAATPATDEAPDATLEALTTFWKPLCLLATSIVLFKTWEELFVVGSALPLPVDGLDGAGLHQVYFSTKAIAFLICALAAPQLDRLFHEHMAPAAVAVGAVLTVAAGIMIAACTIDIGSPVFPMTLSAAAGGIALGALTLWWFALCCRFEPTLALLCYLAASLVSPLVMVVLYQGAFPVAAAAVLLLPAASILCCARSLSGTPSDDKRSRQVREAPSYGKIIALIAVFGFTFGLREPLLDRTPFASGSLTALGSLTVFVAVAGGLLARGPRFNMIALLRAALPLTAVAFLLFPTDVAFMKVVSDFCSSASYDLATLLAILVLTNLCYTFGLFPWRLFGLMFGIRTAGIVLGWSSWDLFALTGMDGTSIGTCFTLVSAAAIALTFLLLPDHRAMRKWGVLAAKKGVEEESAEERLERAVYQFGKRYGLTQREEDVLALIAKGRTGTEIEQELFIARGTLKTHRRNIYAKCGVHSRYEMMALLFPEELQS